MPDFDKAAMQQRIRERVAAEEKLVEQVRNGETILIAERDLEPTAPISTVSERANAIADWCMDATIHQADGTVFAEHIRLLGDRVHADKFAKAIDERLDEHNGEHELAQWLSDPRGAGNGMFKLYTIGPLIAADLMTVLRDLGHV